MKILDSINNTTNKMTRLEIDMYLNYILKSIDIPPDVKYNILSHNSLSRPQNNESIEQAHVKYIDNIIKDYSDEDEAYVLLVNPIVDNGIGVVVLNDYIDVVFICNSTSLIKSVLHRDFNSVFTLYKLSSPLREEFKCINIGNSTDDILQVKRFTVQSALLNYFRESTEDNKPNCIALPPASDKVWNILELNFRYPSLIPILDTLPTKSMTDNNYFSVPIYLVNESALDLLFELFPYDEVNQQK